MPTKAPAENRIIAVDFDGTLVEHAYPLIGRELPFATEVLKELNRRGFRLILWTFRNGAELDAAVQWCKNKGVEFYAINKNYPEENNEEVVQGKVSRKIDADYYIDDRQIGGLPEWGEIFQMLCGPDSRELQRPKRNSFMDRLFGKKQ